jgi:hypothetical protein
MPTLAQPPLRKPNPSKESYINSLHTVPPAPPLPPPPPPRTKSAVSDPSSRLHRQFPYSKFLVSSSVPSSRFHHQLPPHPRPGFIVSFLTVPPPPVLSSSAHLLVYSVLALALPATRLSASSTPLSWLHRQLPPHPRPGFLVSFLHTLVLPSAALFSCSRQG